MDSKSHLYSPYTISSAQVSDLSTNRRLVQTLRSFFGSESFRSVPSDRRYLDLVPFNLLSAGFNGPVYPVNPSASVVQSVPAHPSVRDIGGPVKISNSNGNVAATDIRADLTVDTRFGLVRAERIKGSLDVDNSNGGVTASDVGGSARVHTSFASVFLKGVGGYERANHVILLDGVSFHRYQFADARQAPDILMSSPGEWDYLLPSLHQLIRQDLGRDLPIAVT